MNKLCLLLAAVTPHGASAQDIVVTGRGLANPSSDRVYAIATIDRDRLIATASGRIEDALRDVAGFQQFRRSDARSASPTSQGVTVRGLGGNAASRVLVLLDGVPQGDPFAGYLNWPSYLPERLGRISVTRGGGSGAGGPGALAGTIEMESVGAADTASLSGSLSAGSFGGVEARATAGGRLGNGFAIASGGYARADGFVPVVQRGPVDRGARYDQGSVALRAAVPAFSGELQAAIGGFVDIRARGTDFTRNRTHGADASLRYAGKRLSVIGYVQARSFASQFAAIDPARTAATLTLDQYGTPATGIGTAAEWRPALGGVELRLGGDWRHTSGKTSELFLFVAGAPTRIREAGGRSDTIGAFAEATHRAGPWTLTGSARVDRWLLSEGRRQERTLTGVTMLDSRFADRSGWEATGRVGVAVDAAPSLTLRGAAYLGWRLPTLNELYRPFRVGTDQTLANAALGPERSRGGEIGFEWRPVPAARIGVTVFAMRLDDAIANVTLSASAAGAVRERRNIDAILSSGVEFDGRARAGDWTLAASLSLVDPRVRGTGLRPAQVARSSGSATLAWRGVSLTARYTGAQFDDDTNIRRLRPAFTLDGVATAPLGRDAALVARIENLWNALVPAAISAGGIFERATPRTVWIGLRFGLATATKRG